ncbi:hypothetical protein D3C87_1033730 [compost metagenome]
MFGADAADIAVKDLVNECLGLIDERFALLRRRAVRRQHIEVDVSVSDMAVGNRQALRQFFRQFRFGFGHEGRKFRQRHRNIGAHMGTAQRLTFVHALTEEPQRLCLCPRGGDDAVQHQAVFHDTLEEPPHQVGGINQSGTGNFHQHIGRVIAGDRHLEVGYGFDCQCEGNRRHKFEGGHQVAAFAAGATVKLDGIVK